VIDAGKLRKNSLEARDQASRQHRVQRARGAVNGVTFRH
jgi:hypothetical protein